MHKISAFIVEQFNISDDDLITLINFSRYTNGVLRTDPNSFDVVDVVELEENGIEILNKTFGDREGVIPGECLNYYADELSMNVNSWKTFCADIDL